MALVASQSDVPSAFLLEAALDCGYFQELLARSDELPSGEDRLIKPLSFQEANLFQFLMVARGKLHFGVPVETLRQLRLARNGADQAWFDHLLSAPDVLTMAKVSLGIVIDTLPAAAPLNGAPHLDFALVERHMWQRYLRLANHVFRCSHMGPAAVAAYFCLRRVEVANLISLSEGIRLGVDKTQLRERSISRTELEAAHV
jgi:vacuolar-type H+-ATPase subunit C/Vma6